MMRKIFYFIVIIATASCKKDTFKTPGVASLTIANAISGGTSIKLGSQALIITNNNYSQLAVNSGDNELYVWPVGDSAHPYYTNEKFNVADREVYSLFLGGTPSAVDGIIIKEDIPYRTDSTGGIRFMNLSPNSPLLNINLLSSPTISEVSNLGYKQYTEFKSYPALASTVPYAFQIRNASTGVVLLTYSFNTSSPLIPRFSNITLVIKGLVNGVGPTALGVTRVFHDR